jgi:hypothetical protein
LADTVIGGSGGVNAGLRFGEASATNGIGIANTLLN